MDLMYMPSKARPVAHGKVRGIGAALLVAAIVLVTATIPRPTDWIPPSKPAVSPSAVLAGATMTPGDSAESAIDVAASDDSLAALQQRFESVIEAAAPAVVAISASAMQGDSEYLLGGETMNARKLTGLLDRTTRTVGTGFVIDRDGFIVTNEHVIGDAESIWVTMDNGRVHPAVVVGSDPRSDLAVLKIPAKNLAALQLAPAEPVRRGQWTLAIGNPFGLAVEGRMAASVGVVSATGRSLSSLSVKENRHYADMIQTTAQINPGNSGGPLLDLSGRVMAINTAVILPQKTMSGIGFAIPITPRLIATIDSLKQGCEVVYSYLGVTVSTPTVAERRSAGIQSDRGVRVRGVEESSPASGAGLCAGDWIVSIASTPVGNCDEFIELIGRQPLEQPCRIEIRRDGREQTLAAHLRKRLIRGTAITGQTQRLRWRGMLLGPIPAHWDFGRMPRPAHGLMVLAMTPDSPMGSQGVRPGSIIARIGSQPVNSILEAQEILWRCGGEECSVTLVEESGGSAASVVSARD